MRLILMDKSDNLGTTDRLMILNNCGDGGQNLILDDCLPGAADLLLKWPP